MLVISKKGQKLNENFCITIVHSHNRNEMRGLVRPRFKVAFVSLSFPKYFLQMGHLPKTRLQRAKNKCIGNFLQKKKMNILQKLPNK